MSDEQDQILAKALEQIEKLKAESARFEEEAAAQKANGNILSDQIEALKEEVTKLRQDTATLTKQRDTFEEGFLTQQKKHEAAAKANVRLSRENAGFRDTNKKLDSELTELKGKDAAPPA